MRSWEKKYEKLIQGNELNDKLAELEKKMEDKNITKDEYGEYEKLKAVKDNLPKVANVLQYRGVLLERLKKTTKEIENIKEIKHGIDYQNEEQSLEKELSNLMYEKEKLGVQIKQTEKGSEKEAEIIYRLKEINNMIDKNNAKFSEVQLSKAKYEEKNNALGEKTEEELLANKMNINSKISKCNMICNNLLQGYSWNSIDMALEKWQDRRLTSDKEIANRMKQAVRVYNKENDYEKVDNKENIYKRVDNKEVDNKEKVETNLQSTQIDLKLPEKVSEFDKKHPRIAVIKNMFKRAGQWVKNAVTSRKTNKSELEAEKTEETPKENNEKYDIDENQDDYNVNTKQDVYENYNANKKYNVNTKHDVNEKYNTNEKDEFRDYIKVVAEKGYEQANREKLQKMKDKNNSRNDREDETR